MQKFSGKIFALSKKILKSHVIMLRNRLTKMRILGLLLAMGYNAAMATDTTDALDEEALQLAVERVANAFEVLKNGPEEQRAEAKELLHSEGIIPEAFYAQEDIERAWNDEWVSFAQNVVIVNQTVHDAVSGLSRQPAGTGTLIDVGIPGLEGRVVVTCSHVVLPKFRNLHIENNSIAPLCSDENGSNQILSIGSQKLRHFRQSNDESLHKAGWFGFGENCVGLSITAECQRGEFSGENPITDLYVLMSKYTTTNCYDMAVCILKEPVKYKGEIIPGVSLDKLNAFTETERINEGFPCHICLEDPLGAVLPMDKCPVVIGYGLTGLRDVYIPHHLSLGFSKEQKQSFFGSGIKKQFF
jgi:hypothetical protein